MTATVLEWAAFLASLASVWFYGKSGLWGPVAGVVTALLFFAFGIMSGIYAAIVANVVFLTLHLKNGILIMQTDETRIRSRIEKDVGHLVNRCHTASRNAGWWDETPADNRHVVPAKLCLIHSEITEAMEGDRRDLMDDKLPHRSMIETELADAAIRIFDLAGALNLDLGGAMAEKMQFNSTRPDHKPENRGKKGGKKY